MLDTASENGVEKRTITHRTADCSCKGWERLLGGLRVRVSDISFQVWDGPYGNPNAGKYYHGNGCCEPLTAIEVFATGSRVFGIQFSYGGVRKGRMGSPTGVRFELELSKQEVITSVEGAGETWLTKLVFKTNRGRTLVAGGGTGGSWRSAGTRLDDVSGFASEDGIRSLSFAWKPDPQVRSKGLLSRVHLAV
jgi:hypothetical protein